MILPALNEISYSQAKLTEFTKEECQQIIDYLTTYQHIYIQYYVSDMILLIDSNTAYLVIPKAKSRVVGYFQLNDDPKQIPYPIVNGVILVKYKALRYVVLSATKAETARIFYNAQVAIPIQYILEQLDH